MINTNIKQIFLTLIFYSTLELSPLHLVEQDIDSTTSCHASFVEEETFMS